MENKFEIALEAHCKNWFAKSGKVEDVSTHDLVEGIHQAYNKDKKVEEYLRNSFRVEYYSRIRDICSGVKEPVSPCGKLVAIYQLNNGSYPRLFAIIDQGERLGFGIGRGYDPIKGYWDQGEYNYKSFETAVEALKEEFDVGEIYHV